MESGRPQGPASRSITSRPKGCVGALDYSLQAFQDTEAWTQLMRNGMAKDFSWERQVRLYEELYRRLIRR
ncbi:MAG: hypothetical protein R2862_12155 [Thermoanaerobaculia bacterium]